jgi:succinate dehydrogenase/fumarate reductase-like Fe-S protein
MTETEDRPRSERMVTLIIGSSEYQVPAGETILGCLQHLRMASIMMGGFCWKAECLSCEVLVEYPWGDEERVLACQAGVVAGLRIREMSEKLRLCLHDLA